MPCLVELKSEVKPPINGTARVVMCQHPIAPMIPGMPDNYSIMNNNVQNLSYFSSLKEKGEIVIMLNREAVGPMRVVC